jgi:protein phosphatase 1 regulatory subunit 37
MAEMRAALAAAGAEPGTRNMEDIHPELARQATALNHVLASLIQKSTDSSRLDELLSLNDELNDLLAGRYTPKLVPTAVGDLGLALSVNGHGGPLPPPEEDVDEALLTPRRIDKGKAREKPIEPELLEKVTSPTFVLDSEDEDGSRFPPFPPSDSEVEQTEEENPTERSRHWVAEEGEVFRKGNALLTEEEMEGDYAGEELRQEVRFTLLNIAAASFLTLKYTVTRC